VPRRLSHTLWLALAIAQQTQQAHAELKFNSGFLQNDGAQHVVDLSVFAKGDFVLPGTKSVDLYVNRERFDRRDLVFATPARDQSATACITKGLLNEIGVLFAAVPALASVADDACVDLAGAIPDATAMYDAGQQRLDISIPQAMIRRTARGTVPQSEWDNGIDAGFVDYSLRASNSSSASQAPQQSYYANLRSGLNVGGWRLRNYSSYNKAGSGSGDLQIISSYAEHDIASIGGRVRAGDAFTSGTTFNSTQFRGVQVSSDDNMLPDSMQGYAPVIRGVARSNAKVEVKQNAPSSHRGRS
jgi:outer membrane usher protein